MLEFFKRLLGTEEEEKEYPFEQELLERFETSLEITHQHTNPSFQDNPAWQEIQAQDKQVRERIAILGLYKLMKRDVGNYHYHTIRKRIFKSEFNPKASPTQESLIEVFKIFRKVKSSSYYFYGLPVNDLIFCFDYYKQHFGRDKHYQTACNILNHLSHSTLYLTDEIKKIAAGIAKINYDANDNSIFDQRDVLGKHLSAKWEVYPDVFKEVIAHCWEPKQKSKPTKKWDKASKALIERTENREEQINDLAEIFELLITSGLEEVKRRNHSNDEAFYRRLNCYLFNPNEVAASYLVWYAVLLDSSKLNSLIGEFALSSYKKINGVGPLSTKNGNACLYAFTIMPPETGITQLISIRDKTRNNTIKNTANKHLKRKAEELGLSEEALLELSVPTYNLEGNLSKWKIGGYTGVVDITQMKHPVMYWINDESAKKQKSTPKEVTQNHKEELKAFKATVKELKTAIGVHNKRLENSYLDNIEWSIADWTKYYRKHPFLSKYASRLIWQFDNQQTAIQLRDTFVDAKENPVDISQVQSVKLWHTIYSDSASVADWRNFILSHEVSQPFKQAYREIYLVTDAELATNTYSNRFAAHILYQHQFAALAKTRGWTYFLQGDFDSHNTPSRSIPKYQLRAEFWVEPISDETTPSGIFTFVASDQVRIYNGREILEMADVPKLVFSEIMRDVDLFVGVTSIGNNPDWEDVGDRRAYWHTYSFGELGETAKTRKVVLERILPKLKISDKSSLDDKFLYVKGSIRDYKIHLGSGNILMTPNDQYLCIVPGRKDEKSKIFLPFDNDRTLPIILSKAFLLYEDDKITDPTITRQINL
ncbi:MAG: DUF4132 domain-containing protein [Bacteroidota bacterium]